MLLVTCFSLGPLVLVALVSGQDTTNCECTDCPNLNCPNAETGCGTLVSNPSFSCNSNSGTASCSGSTDGCQNVFNDCEGACLSILGCNNYVASCGVSSWLTTPVIIGISVGGAALVIIVAFLIWRNKRKNRQTNNLLNEGNVSYSVNGPADETRPLMQQPPYQAYQGPPPPQQRYQAHQAPPPQQQAFQSPPPTQQQAFTGMPSSTNAPVSNAPYSTVPQASAHAPVATQALVQAPVPAAAPDASALQMMQQYQQFLQFQRAQQEMAAPQVGEN